nr:hypothetical protein [Lachnospiraceae bacterium]
MNDSEKYFNAVKYAYDLSLKEEEEVKKRGYGYASGANSVKSSLERWDIKEPVYDEKTDWKKVLYQIHLDLVIGQSISELNHFPDHAWLERHMEWKISEYVEQEKLMDDFLAKDSLKNHQEYRELIAEYGLKKDPWEK